MEPTQKINISQNHTWIAKKRYSNTVHQIFPIFAFTLLSRFDFMRVCFLQRAFCWQGTINVLSEKSTMTFFPQLIIYVSKTKPLNTNKMPSHVHNFRKYTLALDKKSSSGELFFLAV